MLKGLTAVQHPGPVHALVELRCEVMDLRIVEVGAAGERAAKEEGRVNRGDFTSRYRLAGAHIVEV